MNRFIESNLKTLSLGLSKILNKENMKEASQGIDLMKNKIIKDKEELFLFLKEKKVEVNIDSPKGSKKGFGWRKRIIPFDYGEIPSLINPSDDMGWDIIFPPSEEPAGGKLIPIGVVEVSPDKKQWKEKSNKEPPIGNDKIIVSKKGIISEEDKKILEEFFNPMWQFKKIKWLS